MERVSLSNRFGNVFFFKPACRRTKSCIFIGWTYPEHILNTMYQYVFNCDAGGFLCMEILYNEAALNRIAGSAAAQAMVESDIPLPENHRDVARVLDADGSVNVDNVEVLEGRFMLEGSLTVKLICMAPDGTAFAFESATTFKNSAAVEGAQPGMSFYCKPELLELSCEPMDGRIRLSATVEFICRAMDNTPVKTLSGVRGANDIQMLTREAETALQEAAGDAVIRMREEIAASGVSDVIAESANAVVRDVTEQGNSAAVEGTLTFNALCANSEGQLTQLVQHLPFGELVEMDSCSLWN
jgi:hypothetical protein